MNIQGIPPQAECGSPARIGGSRALLKDSASVISPQQEVLNEAEQDFFAELFPASENEIRNYSTYTPAGVHLPATSGTLIDRKG